MLGARDYLDAAIRNIPEENTMDSHALLLSRCYSLIDNYSFASATSLFVFVDVHDEQD